MSLLLKSPKAIIANNISFGFLLNVHFQAIYNASKAAFNSYTETLRRDLEPFDIAVVNLRTGGVKTNSISNGKVTQSKSPKESTFDPAREHVDTMIGGDRLEAMLSYPADD